MSSLKLALPGLLFAACANAGPADGVVRGGTATISQTANTTTVTQTSNRAVIDWRTFNIAPAETVNFLQPNAQAAVLNRVTGGQFSSLQGTLTANGQVFLVNPNGVLIGNGATINVGSFFVSTANISTAAFMRDPVAAAGRYAFDELAPGAGTASIVNAGNITVAEGGMVALVAPGVKNSGVITARLGTIELASATHFTLDLFGDDLIRLALGDSVAGALMDNTGSALTAQIGAGGQLTADGGRIVLLSVPAAVGVVNDAINLSGVLRAQSVGLNQRGEISLLANQGAITIGGGIDASSAVAGVQGGDVSVIGSTLHLTNTARINASGLGGGGMVVLGGKDSGSFGSGTAATTTGQTTVDLGALVSACGTAACAQDGTGGAGDGGTIRLYSTLATTLNGEINVSSGAVNRAGIMEVVSDSGVTSMGSQARMIGITGEAQLAGFAAIIGNTLELAPTSLVSMRDAVGNLPDGSPRLIWDSNPGATTRNFVNDPDLVTRQTDQPVLIHAYTNNGVSDYTNHLPTIDAAGVETPVGTLRPNGGAPSSFASSASDTLAAIPVSFPPPSTGGPGTGPDNLNNQVANTANGLTRDAADTTDAIVKAGRNDVGGDTPMLLVVGGPGVAQVADLGRSGPVAGASPDVFGANYSVLAPAGGADDTQIADYLCLTPFAANACRPKPAN
ncbi:MAG: filamentous hemagglutinin N-terminal domain-containing protein [Pseudomonadota bacterium]